MNPPQLAWVTRGNASLSSPYRIVRSIRGYFEIWIYSAHRSGCLARQIDTLNQAKAFCERDAQAQKEKAHA